MLLKLLKTKKCKLKLANKKTATIEVAVFVMSKNGFLGLK
jgi:hypothetical protein